MFYFFGTGNFKPQDLMLVRQVMALSYILALFLLMGFQYVTKAGLELGFWRS